MIDFKCKYCNKKIHLVEILGKSYARFRWAGKYVEERQCHECKAIFILEENVLVEESFNCLINNAPYYWHFCYDTNESYLSDCSSKIKDFDYIVEGLNSSNIKEYIERILKLLVFI